MFNLPHRWSPNFSTLRQKAEINKKMQEAMRANFGGAQSSLNAKLVPVSCQLSIGGVLQPRSAQLQAMEVQASKLACSSLRSDLLCQSVVNCLEYANICFSLAQKN